MKLRWIDSAGAGERDLAELEALPDAQRRISLARHFPVESRGRDGLDREVPLPSHGHHEEQGTESRPTTSCVSGPCVHRRACA